jgi:hypothetical protein
MRETFESNLHRLFDIIDCRCEIFSCGGGAACRDQEHCSGFHAYSCTCDPKSKIPEQDVRFVKEQREKIGLLGGEMMMQGKDTKDAKMMKIELTQEDKKKQRLQKKALAAAKVEEKIRSKENRTPEVTLSDLNWQDDDNNTLEEKIDDPDYVPSAKKAERTTIGLDPYAAETIRYSTSDREAAALWNAMIRCLEDADMLKKSDDTERSIAENLTVDRYKIRRAKAKFGAKQKEKQDDVIRSTGGLKCIGTDGKRNKKTRKRETVIVNGQEVEKYSVGTEEHIVYTQEPGGNYLSHSAVDDGTGRGLAKDAVEVAVEARSKETLCALCCDGTATNTGWKDGMFANVERKLQRKLLCLSCLAHENELPFRKVFDQCDGGFGTSGPTSFNGEMGKRCSDKLHLEDVQKFEAVDTSLKDIDDEVVKDLSRDQNLLYRYIKAIKAGSLPANLATQKAGPINHSRWLTLAIRLLQLYTRTSQPSAGLKTVVNFIMKVYGPVWFLIKSKNKFTNGPAILHRQMQLINAQPAEVQGYARPVVQRNAFMAEPGIMLCAMLESEDKMTRERAVKLVRQLRSKPPKKPRMKVLQGIRKFQVPLLQWNAATWQEMIDWKTAAVHEPYIIECISEEDLTAALDRPHNFPAFPLHTQSVERAVKLVTEAAAQVCGEEKRHEFILSVLEARRVRKAFDTKKDYKLMY